MSDFATTPPELTPPAPGIPPAAPVGPTDDDRHRRRQETVTSVFRDLVFVAAWFAVVAVVAAIVWSHVTPLPEFTRTADNGTMGEEELVKQFGTSGWFFVIAAVGGLVSGIALLLIRRRNPVAMVILVCAGGFLATYVMLRLGLALGPENPNTSLAGAKVGAKVAVQLKPDVSGVYYVWSIAALLGSVVALWGRESSAEGRTAR
ncbi:MAG: hypothetical protein ACJ72D_06665 [Marmoricola sp.]